MNYCLLYIAHIPFATLETKLLTYFDIDMSIFMVLFYRLICKTIPQYEMVKHY